MRILAFTVLLGLAPAAAWAATFTEQNITCNLAFSARVANGAFFVTTNCRSSDANGQTIRSGPVDITSRLTPAQRSGLIGILSQLDSIGAQNNNMPTPAATPTLIAAPTATP